MVTIDDVRELAWTLPRSEVVFVRGRVKFRVGSIVWLAFSHDETEMGFAFPKEWRQALVDSDPEKFFMPRRSDLRFNWAEVRLAAIDGDEIQIHVAPVLLGGGVRLFGELGATPPKVELVRVIESPGATHLRYRIVR